MNICILVPFDNKAIFNESHISPYIRDDFQIHIEYGSVDNRIVKTDEQLANLLPEMLTLATKINRKNYDGVIYLLGTDVNFEAIRRELNVPAVSSFSSTLYFAATMGINLGLISARELTYQSQLAMIKEYGLSHRLKASKLLELKTFQDDTLEINTNAIDSLFAACVDMAREQKVESIILGSPRFARMVPSVRNKLQEQHIRIRLFEPIDCVFAMVDAVLKLKL